MISSGTRLAQLGVTLVRRVIQPDLRLMAAGIAFYLLLSLIPLLLLGASAVGYLLGSSEDPVEHMLVTATQLVPRATGAEVWAVFQAVIGSRHVTGVLGVGMLLWIGLQLFETIAESLRALAGRAARSRSFFRRKLIGLVLMSAAGLLLLSALLGSWIVAAWPNIQVGLGIRTELPPMLRAPELSRYLTAGLLGTLLTTVYWIAPGRDIGWGRHSPARPWPSPCGTAGGWPSIGSPGMPTRIWCWVRWYYTTFLVLVGGLCAGLCHGDAVQRAAESTGDPPVTG